MSLYWISSSRASHPPWGTAHQKNSVSLVEYSPYTEIFSKRRKIYSVCVESMSIQVRASSASTDQLEQVSSVGIYGCSLKISYCKTSRQQKNRTTVCNTRISVKCEIRMVCSSWHQTRSLTHIRADRRQRIVAARQKWGVSEPLQVVLQYLADSWRGRSKLLNLIPFQKSV